MKIVHVSAWDNRGGSAKSALKIHRGLQSLGVDSVMYVSRKELEGDNSVKKIVNGRLFWQIDKKTGELEKILGWPDLFYLCSHFFYLKKDVKNAEIIQIYNIHGGFFEFAQLKKLARHSVLVWRLSDMWSFTGHCAYSFNCDKWKTGCQKCDDLKTYPAIGRDRCQYLWKLKKRVYEKIPNLHIVAPSKWILECARQSVMLRDKDITYIPNGVDCSIFKPMDKKKAKNILGLDENRPVILFLAAIVSDERKGLRYLLDALKYLNDIRNEITVCCVGNGEGLDDGHIVSIGHVTDEYKMAAIYSAADIYVLPSLADNLPNTLLECMACRTAVVAFDVGGIPDVVKHMETGYLVQKENSKALAEGIRALISSDNVRNEIAKNAMMLINEKYTVEIQTRNFCDYYQKLLK